MVLRIFNEKNVWCTKEIYLIAKWALAILSSSSLQTEEFVWTVEE